MTDSAISVGQRIRVSQGIDRREGDWSLDVEGRVISIESQPTGSWHAHGQDAKLWLYRILIEKDSGERSKLVVDRHTRVQIIGT